MVRRRGRNYNSEISTKNIVVPFTDRSATWSLNRLEHCFITFLFLSIVISRPNLREKSISRKTRSAVPYNRSRSWGKSVPAPLSRLIKFRLAMFYRAELNEYSYHVEKQAVLAKYSSRVPLTCTKEKKGRGREKEKEWELRKNRGQVDRSSRIGRYSTRDSIRGCAMAARYTLNNITKVTRVAIAFSTFPDFVYLVARWEGNSTSLLTVRRHCQRQQIASGLQLIEFLY